MEQNEHDSEITRLLRSIDTSLKILVVKEKAAIIEYISTQYLTTDNRKKMYPLFDGEHSFDEIGEAVKTSRETVRQFAEALEQEGLVEYVKDGRANKPKAVIPI